MPHSPVITLTGIVAICIITVWLENPKMASQIGEDEERFEEPENVCWPKDVHYAEDYLMPSKLDITSNDFKASPGSYASFKANRLGGHCTKLNN